MPVYSKLAKIYDALYGFKNYEAEVARLHQIISDKKTSPGNALLDVACGTGSHLTFLRKHYAVEGVDYTPEMLEVARSRMPEVTFHQGDMRTFDLGRRFDVVTCLFSSIGYLKTVRDLRAAVINMARHLKPGGVLIVEPWLSEETWNARGIHTWNIDGKDTKIARMDVPSKKGRKSIIRQHIMLGTADGVQYLRQTHELFMFTNAEYIEAFDAAGLDIIYDEKGLMNRGLFIGTSITLTKNR
ncbi:MAG TPA: class I SAM-dependent methyltransferase [Candidatus Binataceae bacterium]|nr:class I SAM-dependent methyltransferase [Candidatus Binataceae bacterium]